MAIHASPLGRSAALRSHGTFGSWRAAGVWSQVTSGGGVGRGDGRVELLLHAGRASAISTTSKSRRGQVDGADALGGVMAGDLDRGQLGLDLQGERVPGLR